jgi:hypothetical protein
MNLDRTLEELRRELAGVNAAIVQFERLQSSSRPKNNRGRKSMGPAERLEVSERMKRYWGERRNDVSQLNMKVASNSGSATV